MSYNAISLFSGAMGLDLGIEKAGFDIRVCVEMDKLAAKTIVENSNIPVINKDINDVTTDEILKTASLKKEEVFLVVGGPPCQAFSTAGARRGLEDFRGNVISNYLRVIKEIEPQFFILENVRGILSTEMSFVPEEYKEYENIVNLKGSVVYFLTKEFEKYGYSVSFSLFNSANYGVPQKRERVIMFGHKGKRIPLPSPTHSATGEETGHKWVTFGEAIEGLNEEDMSFSELSEKMKHYLGFLSGGQYWKHLPKDIVEEAMGNSYHLGGGKTGFYRRLSFNEPSPTLVTSPSMPATMLTHPENLRPLSTQEYARIQQFPDHWRFQGKMLNIYKQIGNAVPVGLGHVAGKTIMDFHLGNYDQDREMKNKIPYSRYKNCSDFEFLPLFEKEIEKQKSLTIEDNQLELVLELV
ncbi:DNA cytosine methyltransferase [Cohnella abietis]|uniref:DNA (cytosine-5-)-methyltransferase n=1 Tax=Cohnella abietis TaxID=2507935 RepID=A0A3T1CY24_9BACL|nr:DNA cytosine methyltransferase [Cohnella abietis]BBI30767.1 cytosine-specific methyltransferase [Cohnella abietis]